MREHVGAGESSRSGRLVVSAIGVLTLGLLVASAGCGGGDEGAGPTTSASGPTSTRAATACSEDEAEAVTVTTQDGTELDAALVGAGDVGIVLGHQLGSDMCAWVPFATQLAKRNLSGLAINFVSASPDKDMVAGAAELQRRGAKRIFLVGASMGGTAALVAAADIDVAGVAALSAPQEFSGLDALPAVRDLEVPVLFLVGRQDESFARDARRLFQVTNSPDKDLVVTSGAEHGTDLLGDPQAKRALVEFLVGG
ncbi:MAG: alpha/beta hydrolase family protein [Gaiellaceae bacterium]